MLHPAHPAPLPEKGPGSQSILLGPACSVWFVTSCRKDFTRVQVILKVCSLKPETVKKEGPSIAEAAGERLAGAALAL